MRWRRMQVADLDGISAVAEQIHPDLPEAKEVLRERVELYPNGCWVLDGAGGRIMGYAISHPIPPQSPPKLNSFLGTIGADAAHYYIHDIALLPETRGEGHAAWVIETLLEHAQRYETVGLVSVYGTAGFWKRFGFQAFGQDMADKLAPYGEGAVYMTKKARAHSA